MPILSGHLFVYNGDKWLASEKRKNLKKALVNDGYSDDTAEEIIKWYS